MGTDNFNMGACFRATFSFFVLLSIGFLIPNTVFLTADVQKVVFVSSPQTIAAGAVSEQITVQAQDSAGNEFKVPITACASLSSSYGGEVSSNATTWSSVSVLTIAKNSANRNFYYKNTVAVADIISVKMALKPESENRSCANWPGGEWPSGFTATQSIVVGGNTPPNLGGASSTQNSNISTSTDENAETTISGTYTPQQSANFGATTWVYKPQIYVSAIVPAKGAAGAPMVFDAVAVGLRKEPITNARYVWSFGDGGVAEGKKVEHIYHYPAAYVVMVDASSGEWSATDRKEVVIATPELLISDVKEGAYGFIEIKNNGASDVDLSEWILRSGSGLFLLPRGTIIGTRKAVPFPAVITKLLADPSSISLLYPNGNTAVEYSEKSATARPVSVKESETTVALAVAKTEDTSDKPAPITKSVIEKTKSEVTPVAWVSSSAESKQSEQTNELLGAVGTLGEGSTTPWLLGVALLLAVSIGGYMTLLRPKLEPNATERLRQEAEEFETIEEK